MRSPQTSDFVQLLVYQLYPLNNTWSITTGELILWSEEIFAPRFAQMFIQNVVKICNFLVGSS